MRLNLRAWFAHFTSGFLLIKLPLLEVEVAGSKGGGNTKDGERDTIDMRGAGLAVVGDNGAIIRPDSEGGIL